jgi:hypothetical protein
MKVWKKLSAVALALVMVMALCVPAFAATVNGQELATANTAATDTDVAHPLGTAGDKDVEHNALNEAVKIKKDITVYNTATNDTNVKEPTATYTYTIAPVNEITPHSIKDADNIEVNAKTGILTALAVSSTTATTATTAQSETSVATTLTYSPTTGTFTAKQAGSTNTKWVTFDFSNVVFTNGAGVYRYLITETISTTAGNETKNDTDAYTASGIVKGTTGNQRYLDVYVKQAPVTSGSTFDGAQANSWDVYGYALFAATTEENIPFNEATSYKTTGFVADQNKTADAYYTYNVTISKTLVNDSVMNSHPFPFKVEFENTDVTANVLPIVSPVGDNTVFPTLTAGAISGMVLDGTNNDTAKQIKIANGGSVTFTGIPHGTTLTIDEQNDVTGTTYTVTTEGGDNNYSNINVVSDWAAAANNNTAIAVALNPKTQGDTMNNIADKTIAFTNTLTNISPTGVTLRYAPYLAMMGAGIVALPLSLRKKEEEL